MISRNHCMFKQNDDRQWTVTDNKVKLMSVCLPVCLLEMKNGCSWYIKPICVSDIEYVCWSWFIILTKTKWSLYETYFFRHALKNIVNHLSCVILFVEPSICNHVLWYGVLMFCVVFLSFHSESEWCVGKWNSDCSGTALYTPAGWFGETRGPSGWQPCRVRLPPCPAPSQWSKAVPVWKSLQRTQFYLLRPETQNL